MWNVVACLLPMESMSCSERVMLDVIVRKTMYSCDAGAEMVRTRRCRSTKCNSTTVVEKFGKESFRGHRCGFFNVLRPVLLIHNLQV